MIDPGGTQNPVLHFSPNIAMMDKQNCVIRKGQGQITRPKVIGCICHSLISLHVPQVLKALPCHTDMMPPEAENDS